MNRFRVSLGFLFAVMLVLAGCASDPGGPASGNTFNAIIGGQADSTPFYLTGPGEQVPDKYLSGGTRARIIGTTDNYTRIQTVDGETGFVPSGAISPMGATQ